MNRFPGGSPPGNHQCMRRGSHYAAAMRAIDRDGFRDYFRSGCGVILR